MISVDPGLWLPVALALPFAAMLVAPLLHRRDARVPGVLGAAAGGTSLLILLLLWVLRGPSTASYPWIPSAGVAFVLRLDALSLLFASLVTGIGAVIFAYAATYMAHERGGRPFYAYMALFMGSMLGLVLSGDLILLFVFWELTTISSFLLIGLHREEPESVAAATKALLITGLGGLALLVSLLGMAAVAGTFDLEAVLASGEALQASGLHLPVLLLFLVAVAAKSAQFPLHIWLPDAMVAPTPVSAYLHSAAMVKAGIFLLARFLPALVSSAWVDLLVPLGTVTMVLGGLMAIRAVELKRILAYSTVSQLGLLATAFGIAGPVGQEAGLLHLLNHAAFKASLFLVAGAVTHATGLTNLGELGGLRHRMPLTGAACGLAALSMAGIPPLGGFLSKELFFEATLETGQLWVPAVALVGGGLTFAYSWNFFARIFLGPPGPEAHEAPALGGPALLLALLSLALGLTPFLATGVIGDALHPAGAEGLAPHLLALKPEAALMSLGSVLLGLLVVWRYGAAVRGLDRLVGALARATPDAAYGYLVARAHGAAGRLGLAVQNGSLQRYTGALLLAVTAALLAPLIPLLTAGGSLPTVDLPPLQAVRDVVLVLVLLALGVFALLAAVLRDTLYAILALSGMGFLLAMVFMLLNAPDLAMTQILVELVFLAIFLIVVYKIPLRAVRTPRRRGAGDVLLASGVFVGATYLVSRSLAAFDTSVAEWFLQPELLDLTGGRNVVNVILTDFRAFDTLGEITVIVLAALGVYALLRGWRRD